MAIDSHKNDTILGSCTTSPLLCVFVALLNPSRKRWSRTLGLMSMSIGQPSSNPLKRLWQKCQMKNLMKSWMSLTLPKIWTMTNWRSGDMVDHIDYLYWLELSWDMNQDMGSNEPQEESNVQEK